MTQGSNLALVRWFPLIVLIACQEEALRHPAPPPSQPIELSWDATERKTPASTPTANPASSPASAETVKTITMLEFMKNYIEPEARIAFRDKAASQKLELYLKELAEMAPEDSAFSVPGKEWKELTLGSMTPATYATGCKACHAAYLKPYKRKYRNDTFEIALP